MAEVKVKIDGMMCEHCEKHVKEALEALPFVGSAAVSHTSGEAVITLTGAMDEAKVREAVEEEGYTVTAI